MDKELYELLVETMQISNAAFANAQEENRRLGLPNVYANHKCIYYELPDGTITTKNPLKKIPEKK
jgi:hypothetical protein